MALPFHDHGTRRGEGSALRPCRSLPPGKDPVPIVQEAGWAPGPVWTGAENLAPPAFDSRTVQPAAIRYTDYATRPTIKAVLTPKKAYNHIQLSTYAVLTYKYLSD